jgi:hypothetical protein
MPRNATQLRSTLTAILIGGVLGMAAPAQAHPAVAFLEVVPLGASAEQLTEAASKLGWSMKKHPWNRAGGMSTGLLERPGLLALLNRYKVKHPFFEGLPDQGPVFHTIEYAGAVMTYGLVGSKVWAIAARFPLSGMETSPFDPARLEPYRASLASLGRLCASFAPTWQDPHGNMTAFRGKRCQGGGLQVRYEARGKPLGASSLLVLLHSSQGRARP